MVICPDAMISHLGHTAGAKPLSTVKNNSKSSAKRTKTVVKQEANEEEEDDEVEEPVRKRSRRSGREIHAKAGSTAGSASVPAQIEVSGETSSTKHPKDEIKKEPASSSKPSTTPFTKSKAAPKATIGEPSNSEGKSASPKDNGGSKATKAVQTAEEDMDEAKSEIEDEDAESDEEDKPDVAAKAREKVQSTLKSQGKDPYPDWKAGEPVPYAALCTTFSLIEMTTKRLIISAHCSLFLRQVLRLTPGDLLPTVLLMINKLAADYAGIELGIGESLIMKAIGESTGRSLATIKADQKDIGDLGLVAAKSRSNQPTMYKPKALTVRGVLDGLMGIATVQGNGSQGRKIDGIKKLLSAADVALAGKGSKGVDITKDKGGASEAKFLIRFLEGKLRLGLAEKTVLVALAHAMVIHETDQNGKKVPSSEELAKGEAILKAVYRFGVSCLSFAKATDQCSSASCPTTKSSFLPCLSMASSTSEKTANFNLAYH